MQMNTVDLTAANLATQQGLLAALAAAAADMVRGNIADTRLQFVTPGSSTPPADENAQIEHGWLITYTDTQAFLDPGPDTTPNPGFGKLFTLEWPCADRVDHLQDNSDFADLAQADMAAFVTAFEDLVVSPYDGTVEILTIRVTGVDA